MPGSVIVEETLSCYHCGELCIGEPVKLDEKDFCCTGCQAVYELFRGPGLEDIYVETNRVRPEDEGCYAYLDNKQIADTLLDFQSDTHNSIRIG